MNLLDQVFARADEAHRTGRLEEAASLYRQVLSLDPRHPQAQLLLGILLGSVGQFDQGIPMLRRLLAQEPSSPETMLALATLLRVTEKVQEASLLCQRAIALQPNGFEAHNELGLCWLADGWFDEAASSFERAIKLQPELAHLQNNYAVALQAAGRGQQAEAVYRMAIELEPGNADVHLRLGRLLLSQGRRDAAIEVARQALEHAPDSAQAHVFVAHALFEDGHYELGETHLHRAIALDPNSNEAFALLGYRQQDIGQFDEAVASYKRCLEIQPRQGAPYFGLAYARKVRNEDRSRIGSMLELLKAASLPPEERSLVHYALGKSLDDLGEYGQAIQHFDEANRLTRKKLGLGFDRAGYAGHVDKVASTFTSEFFEAHRDVGSPNKQAVFVLGMMRSGTTLVEQILSSHPEISGAGELLFWTEHVRAIYQAVFSDKNVHGEARQAAAEYLEILQRAGEKSTRITDKMPGNFMHLGPIHLCLPKARIIHCRRHPVDNCLSIFVTPNRQPPAYSHDRENIVFAYRQYLRIMEHWRSEIPSERLLEIDYEELVADPESVTRRMIAFCGVPWNDDVLNHEKNRRAVNTPSRWQVRQPVYKSSMDRWRNYEPWLGVFRELLP